MRLRRLTVALVCSALAATVAATGATTSPAAADETSPQAWARRCSSGLGTSTVRLAPILADDKDDGGRPIRRVPDSRGRFVPVVFVHGWTSTSVHDSARTGAFSAAVDLSEGARGTSSIGRSLIGQVQRQPGAAVFTFDYHRTSGRWVDDKSNGPALGTLIDCLYRESGEQVVLIGHSMGGLLARNAVGRQSDGADRAQQVSTVITLGTPNTGSLLAAATMTGLDLGAAGGAPTMTGPAARALRGTWLVRQILATCGAAKAAEQDSDWLCSRLGPVAANAYGPAGRALRAGSSQLRDLPPLPTPVDAVALAGQTTVDLPGVGLFTLPLLQSTVDVGDVVVMPDSAHAGADRTGSVRCRTTYSLPDVAADKLLETIRLEGLSKRRDTLWNGDSPCFHNNLMRTKELARQVSEAVAREIDGRQGERGLPPQAAVAAGDSRDDDGTRTPVLVVLDTSSSMSEPVGTTDDATSDPSGVPKIQAAQQAVSSLIDSTDPAQTFGAITYPGGSATIEECSAGRSVVPLGQIEPATARLAISKVVPDGDTPTGPALLHAAEELERTGSTRGVIVLVSDGESNCGQTPVCEVADQLRDRGFELTVNSVGFDLAAGGEAEAELRCVAEATDGTYLQAGDAEGLRAAVAKAAGAYVSVSADVPEQIPTVVGQGTSGETGVKVTVTNESNAPAQDVRVAMDYLDDDAVGGAVLVPRPIRFLGGLAPGESRSVTINVHPDPDLQNRTFSWIASVTSRNGAADAATGTVRVAPVDLGFVGPVLTEVRRPAVLGDFLSASDGDPRRCARARASYAALLFSGAVDLSCAGTVTSGVGGTDGAGAPRDGSQLSRLADRVASDAPPDAAFVTVGANDAGLPAVVDACLRVTRCSTRDWTSLVDGRMSDIRDNRVLADTLGSERDLARVYRDVDRVLNSPSAVAARGRHAPVVVVPYPRVTPRTATAAACGGRLAADELTYVNELTETVNLAAGLAVTRAAREGRPIYYAADVQEAFQPRHTVCAGAASYADLLVPNAAGQRAIAETVNHWSHGVTEVSASPSRGGERRRSTRSWLRPVDAITRTSVGPVAEEGARSGASGSGFSPGTQVVARLASTPVVVGSAVADASGGVDASVRLPRSVPVGVHHLRLTGLGADGRRRTTSRTIVVLPRFALEAVLSVGLGLGLVLLSHRRRRRRPAAGVED